MADEGATSPTDALLHQKQIERKRGKGSKKKDASEAKPLVGLSTCDMGQSPLLQKTTALKDEIGYDES